MSVTYKCLVVDDEPIAREIIVNYIAKVPSLILVSQCKDATEALGFLTTDTIDLIFLDINMPEISGISLAKSIKEGTHIIFTTAYREYASEGFEVSALDYLVKPIAFERFFKAVQKFLSQRQSSDTKQQITKDSFFVRAKRKMIRIEIDNIRYIESLGDYVQIFTKQGKVVTRESLAQIMERLPEPKFLRVHRSFVVSKGAVDSYTHEFVEIGGKAIPISRTYKEAVLKSFQS